MLSLAQNSCFPDPKILRLPQLEPLNRAWLSTIGALPADRNSDLNVSRDHKVSGRHGNQGMHNLSMRSRVAKCHQAHISVYGLGIIQIHILSVVPATSRDSSISIPFSVLPTNLQSLSLYRPPLFNHLFELEVIHSAVRLISRAKSITIISLFVCSGESTSILYTPFSHKVRSLSGLHRNHNLG